MGKKSTWMHWSSQMHQVVLLHRCVDEMVDRYKIGMRDD